MGDVYTINVASIAVTGSVDLFEITPADDRALSVHALFVGQTSDVGDAAEEILQYQVIRGYTATGSGGTAPTPRSLKRNSQTASFTAKALNQVLASGGTPHIIHADTFNIRVGLPLILPPEMRWEVTQGDTLLVVRLISVPADALTAVATLYVEEF